MRATSGTRLRSIDVKQAGCPAIQFVDRLTFDRLTFDRLTFDCLTFNKPHNQKQVFTDDST